MKTRWIFSLLAALLVLFVGLPLVKMMVSTGPDTLLATAGEREVQISVLLTLRAALWATLAALVCGVPLAYLLARKSFKGKKILEGLIDLPVIIPHTAAGIALLTVWGRHSLMGKVLGFNIVGTEIAISMAMFFVSVPFLVNSAKEGFKLIDERLEKTAITLGASQWQAFRTITLPLARRPIIAGSIMMWGRGISEFGAVVILAYHPMTAPVLIFERFQNFGLKYALPVTVLLIFITLIIFILMRVFQDKK
jgi:molybdate/tungstate transport system permease protein